MGSLRVRACAHGQRRRRRRPRGAVSVLTALASAPQTRPAPAPRPRTPPWQAGKEGQYEREGYGQRPYDNWERIMVPCEGLKFDTVMSAMKSNNER